MQTSTDRQQASQNRKSQGNGSFAALSMLPPLSSGNADSPEHRATQLRLFLQNLGPAYSSFALYLSSRLDLFPAEYCREFALTPDESSPIGATDVLACLEAEFSGRVELTFPRLDLLPLRSTLIAQYHAAELANGTPVVIVILRPEFHQLKGKNGIECLLDRALLNKRCPELMTGAALTDFLALLGRKVDFDYQAEKREQIFRDAASFEALEGERVYQELSSSRVLILSRTEASGLDHVLQSRRFTADRLATLLCKVWLQHAIFGGCVPVDPRYRDVMVSDVNRVNLGASDLVTLSRRVQGNLWKYLLATTTDDPDGAARYLLKEMSHAAPATVDYESFRSSFRQSAYFGALEPVLGTDSNAFAQLVFQHWKTAMTHGFTADAPLLSFYRGLFSIARIARDIDPSGDPLRRALEELRTARIVEQVQDFVDVRFLSQNFDKFLIAVAHLPGVLNDALTRAAQPQDPGSPQKNSGKARRGDRDRTAVLLAFTFLVATVLLSQSAGVHSSLTRSAVALLMLIGVLILRGLKE